MALPHLLSRLSRQDLLGRGMRPHFAKREDNRQQPLELLRKLSDQAHPFCFYSGSGGSFSYAASNPSKICKVYPKHLEIGDEKIVLQGQDPFLLLEEEFALKGQGEEFLQAAWVGYWSYEMSRFADEHFPKRDLPDDFLLAWWGYYPSIWLWDHNRGLLIQEGEMPANSSVTPRRSSAKFPEFKFSGEDYQNAVQRILDYIDAGDCYQVNLAQVAEGEISDDFDAIEIFIRIALRHPSPFSAYLDCGTKKILSLSPEELLWMQGENIRTSPIKGTRRRGANTEEDARIRAELEQSKKEKAELLMIVDLERNDLGKVCEAGSVKVSALREILSLDYVHHAMAVIEGKKKKGLSPLEVTRALFPGGSITGAPKKRAMEIIQELESGPRGVYTGAIGFYGNGLCHLNIAIRSLELEGNRAMLGMGSGIVSDSRPEEEYQELLTKAKAFGE